MVEVQCETDFVARNEEFREFAREVAIHVAGSPTLPRYVSAEEIPESERDAERRVHEAKAKEASRTTSSTGSSRASSPSGRSRSPSSTRAHRSDRYEGKTIEEIRAEIAANTGENICIARFARFAVGEE